MVCHFPEYIGLHEDLEMVEDADRMLDALSTDGLYVALSIGKSEWDMEDDFFTLELEAHDDEGK